MYRITTYLSLQRSLSLIMGIGLFVIGFACGAQQTIVVADPAAQSDRDALFAPFWETWDLLHESYVAELDDTALMEGALGGMMDTLGDEYSFYMDPETFAIVNTDLTGEFEGIGATVRQNQDTGALVIVNTLPGSPAEAENLLNGDAIVQVDGVDVTSMTQSEIISRVRGPASTVVNLGIMRTDEPDMLLFNVTRAHIHLDSVQTEVLENGIAYIRLIQFGTSTTQELRDALLELDVETRPGLILDFRGNPGGFLSTSIEVASEFIPEGVVLYERFRDGERVYEAHGNMIAPTVPMVILVDENSASASEIVAGALQDGGRATIVGTTTLGKGSVQTWRRLSNDGGVRITIALWYTPDDRSIDQIGLTPDIEVVTDPLDSDQDLQLMEAIRVLTSQVSVPVPQQ